jgi:thiol-disulfide isomerase/thioredoxin
VKVKVISAAWCHACLLMKKRIKEFQKTHDIQFEFIDLDFDEDKLVGLDIGKVLPVYFVYQNETLIKRFVGEKTLVELEKEIHDAI